MPGVGNRKLLSMNAENHDAAIHESKAPKSAPADEAACEETYGIFPCSNSLPGRLLAQFLFYFYAPPFSSTQSPFIIVALVVFTFLRS
jgi:hypothetical protein